MNPKLVRELLARLQKEAAVPPAPPMDPAMAGGMPMDPAMMGMPPAPPMDPAMAGGAPMPPVDPATGMPIDPATGMPMDPAMMGMPPAPPMDPAMAGGMPPPMPADPAAMGAMPIQLTLQDLQAILAEATAGNEERFAKIEGLLQQIASAVGGASPKGISKEDAGLEEPTSLLNEGLTDEAMNVEKTAAYTPAGESPRERWQRELALDRERTDILGKLRKFKVIV
jgi:hypothetical protein